MPELPEVEIAARRLREWLVGRRVTRVVCADERLLAGASEAAWNAALVGRRVRAVCRRGKFLLLDFAGDTTAIAHLRMTGRFRREPATAEPPRSARLFLYDDAEWRVTFIDPRRLGTFRVVPTAAATAELALGPDALLAPPTPARLGEIVRGRRASIKSLLMDQRLLAGLGNICTSEILFRAGIAPDLPAGRLTEEQIERLAHEIPEYLRAAIAAQAARAIVYLGERGAVNPFALYGRAGEPCPRCGAPIRRRVIAGRSTYFCPSCQPG
mgnify:CR=1 FL=1